MHDLKAFLSENIILRNAALKQTAAFELQVTSDLVNLKQTDSMITLRRFMTKICPD